MWIETDTGALVHLDGPGHITIQNNLPPHTKNKTWAITLWRPILPNVDIATFKTPAQAEAAKDRLKKWIASDGEDGLAEVTQQGNATIVSPNWTQVFSFRTLSEDDEF